MSHPPRKIRFDDSVRVSERACKDIVTWLLNLKQTIDVQNVESDPKFQEIDVDLILTTNKGKFKIEIKGDQWANTGNFFFETISNKEKNTPGCFLYTEADFVFYYFIEPQILYILPIPITRDWFKYNLHRFEERATTTPIGAGGAYTTVGRLVPIATLLEEAPDVKRVHLKKYKLPLFQFFLI